MKCKCCKKELVVKDTFNYTKDYVKFVQKAFHCTNEKCEWCGETQKVSITCPE